MLEQITPVVLTQDEAANIGRTLSKLRWARDVVVVDGGSGDGTRAIAAAYPNARVIVRAFDCHARQWNFAIHETGISTAWVLALDADHVLEDRLIEELAALEGEAWAGFRVRFGYRVLGKPLRGALYPPLIALYRRDRARYRQVGHTQRVCVDGAIGSLQSRIVHDDRKPLERWLAAQHRYVKLEADRLEAASWASLGWSGRARKLMLVAPAAVPLWSLLVRGGVLDGWPGIYYALQRLLAESLLSLELVRRRLDSKAGR